MLILLTALASGCATTSGDYCDIAGPMWFANDDVVQILNEEDPALLRRIIVNNETWEELCP